MTEPLANITDFSPTPVIPETFATLGKEVYPEIIQAARWMDEDNGTPHFEPGVGFIVDDPDNLAVPVRWLPFLQTIEQALASLDHVNPAPLDVDTVDYLRREALAPGLFSSEAYCFICGEHTPQTEIAYRTEQLYIAHRFFNEYFEGWEFNPSAEYTGRKPS